jgi:hypothetical protein
MLSSGNLSDRVLLAAANLAIMAVVAVVATGVVLLRWFDLPQILRNRISAMKRPNLAEASIKTP